MGWPGTTSGRARTSFLDVPSFGGPSMTRPFSSHTKPFAIFAISAPDANLCTTVPGGSWAEAACEEVIEG